MSDPIFFIIRRTPRTVVMEAATAFDPRNRTYKRMSTAHPRAHLAARVISMAHQAVKFGGIDATIDAVAEILQRQLPEWADKIGTIPAREGVPARIVIRG